MYLFIDLSVQDTIALSLLSINQEAKHFVAQEKNKELLACVDTFLSQHHLSTTDIQGIAVVVGAGSFTNTRIGVTLANTWAYVLHIPIAAVSVEEAAHIEEVIPKITAQPIGQYISATYSAEPNIGKK
ncbi:MAG: hypothetical protein KBD15_01320 [Candidatus Magasanikbacteria bacterium]|jgi:tRNA A37 threonylcarbamoyladenosine modification protein TsaB|nr:hypothetical protein [Candidatus Magasanikbacteria bacterium]